jgi:hypothetical protein
MQFSRFRHLASAGSLVAAVLGTGALAQTQVSEPATAEGGVVVSGEPRVKAVLVEEKEGPERELKNFNIRLDNVVELGYWVGLQLEPVPDAVRSQL